MARKRSARRIDFCRAEQTNKGLKEFLPADELPEVKKKDEMMTFLAEVRKEKNKGE